MAAGDGGGMAPAARAERLIPMPALVLLLTDLALAVAYLLDHALGQPFWISTRLLDLDGEGNIPAWYSSAQLLVLAAAFGLLAAARIARKAPGARGLLPLPLLCLALSCDEIAQVHEWFGRQSDVLLAAGHRQDTAFARTGIWMFLAGPPFAALLFLAGRRLAPVLAGQPQAARLYLAAAAVYLGSALGLEALSNVLAQGSIALALGVTGEETGEMLGVTLAVWATLLLLREEDLHLRIADRRL